MKRMLTVFLSLFLIACTSKPPGDQIVLKVYRGGLLYLFNPQQSYIINSDGSGEAHANLPPGLGDHPVWSPDAQWVVFDTWLSEGSRAGGNADIYLMRSDGSHRVQVTDDPSDDMEPTWSPDGAHIAYTAGSTISILDVQCFLQGQDCHPRPVSLAHGSSPDWSPDGKRIVYQPWDPHDGITIINADGRGNPLNLTPARSGCNHPRWAPDGHRIVFNCPGNVYVVNSDGSGLVNLTEGKSGGDPVWSPDGSKIIFVSDREGGHGLNLEGSITSDALYSMNPDGSNVVRLSHRDDESVLWYAWLPSQRTPSKP